MSKGYTGKFLRINLTDGSTKVETFNQDFYRKYLGGGGFGTYLKRAGCDAVIITGKASQISYVLIEDGNISILSADKDDKLPSKMFEPLYDGPSKGRSVNEEDFNRMKSEYYVFLVGMKQVFL